MVTSNGTRVLSRLGFSFPAAQAVKTDMWSVVHGDSLEPVAKVDLSSAEHMFGAPVWAIHRVDLHNELRRLATSETELGCPVRIHLASEVIGASTDGSIVLKNKSKPTADLVIAADGLHSVLKGVVLEQKALPPTPTGLSAFRFLIDTQKMRESDTLSATMEKKGPGATLLADTKEIAKERHIMWYPCRKFVFLPVLEN
jgi:salicylate hydroxylase